jgi:hypothetical protein
MNRILAALPRQVLISSAAILVALIAFAIMLPVVGGARDEAFAENSRLNGEIGRVRTEITQAKTDADYVKANVEAFEALLKGDRLIPHTRRAATVALENAARANGLTALSYNIQAAAAATSPQAVQSQPKTRAYRLSVENIELKIAANIDGAVYRFVDDISRAFPGSAVIQDVSVTRAPVITAASLDQVSRGQDAKLVEGTINLSWRTAQAEEENAAGGAK